VKEAVRVLLSKKTRLDKPLPQKVIKKLLKDVQKTKPALAKAIREEHAALQAAEAALQAAELALQVARVQDLSDPLEALQALVDLRNPQSANALGKKELIKIINGMPFQLGLEVVGLITERKYVDMNPTVAGRNTFEALAAHFEKTEMQPG